MATLDVSNINHQDIATQSSDISDVLVRMSDLYKKLLKLPGKVFAYALIVILLPFVLLYIMAVIELFYRKIKRRLNAVEIKIDSVQKYKDIRESFDDIQRTLENLAKLKKDKELIELKISLPLILIFLYPIIARITRILSLLKPYNLKLKIALDKFDNNSQKGNLFQSVKEEELWGNRNKQYEYLM